MAGNKAMAFSAAEEIAEMMGRTFMEYVPMGKRSKTGVRIWRPRTGTLVVMHGHGNKYELAIAGSKIGLRSHPWWPQSFTPDELNEFRRFYRNMMHYKAKSRMRKLKNSKMVKPR